MLQSIDPIIVKEYFSIKDLAKVVNKQSQTIRKWEKKGVISKCKNYGDNGWRQYNRQEFADVLDEILNYPWKRNCLINRLQIRNKR